MVDGWCLAGGKVDEQKIGFSSTVELFLLFIEQELSASEQGGWG